MRIITCGRCCNKEEEESTSLSTNDEDCSSSSRSSQTPPMDSAAGSTLGRCSPQQHGIDDDIDDGIDDDVDHSFLQTLYKFIHRPTTTSSSPVCPELAGLVVPSSSSSSSSSLNTPGCHRRLSHCEKQLSEEESHEVPSSSSSSISSSSVDDEHEQRCKGDITMAMIVVLLPNNIDAIAIITV